MKERLLNVTKKFLLNTKIKRYNWSLLSAPPEKSLIACASLAWEDDVTVRYWCILKFQREKRHENDRRPGKAIRRRLRHCQGTVLFSLVL
jgi:hypothetical protein